MISYTSFDYQAVSIVPVISSFDTKGHITPLYVRINGESKKIDSFWTNEKFGNIVEFRCQIIDGVYKKPLVLTYYEKERVWTVPKYKSD